MLVSHRYCRTHPRVEVRQSERDVRRKITKKTCLLFAHVLPQVKSVEKMADGKVVVAHLLSGKRVKGDALLYAMGRLGNTDSLHLEVRVPARGRVFCGIVLRIAFVWCAVFSVACPPITRVAHKKIDLGWAELDLVAGEAHMLLFSNEVRWRLGLPCSARSGWSASICQSELRRRQRAACVRRTLATGNLVLPPHLPIAHR